MDSRFLRQRILSLVILLGLVSSPLGAETRDSLSDARPPAVPFAATEQLYYEGEFSKLMLRGIDIVEIRFSAAQSPQSPPSPAGGKDTKAEPNYLFTAEATSKGWFSKLFGWRFNHRIESTVEARSFTALRTGKTDEQGKRVRTSEAIFDRAADKITWTERDPNEPAKPPRVVSSNVCGAVHDVISAFYFLRTQPLAPQQTFDLTVTDSGKIYHLPARVVETKKIKTALGEMPAVRVDVEIFGPDRLVKSKGEFSVWFSADAKRLPLQARVDTNLGTLEIKLKKVAS